MTRKPQCAGSRQGTAWPLRHSGRICLYPSLGTNAQDKGLYRVADRIDSTAFQVGQVLGDNAGAESGKRKAVGSGLLEGAQFPRRRL